MCTTPTRGRRAPPPAMVVDLHCGGGRWYSSSRQSRRRQRFFVSHRRRRRHTRYDKKKFIYIPKSKFECTRNCFNDVVHRECHIIDFHIKHLRSTERRIGVPDLSVSTLCLGYSPYDDCSQICVMNINNLLAIINRIDGCILFIMTYNNNLIHIFRLRYNIYIHFNVEYILLFSTTILYAGRYCGTRRDISNQCR